MGYRFFRNCTKFRLKAAEQIKRYQSWLLAALVASTISGLSGCTAVGGAKNSWNYSSMMNEMMMGYRNEAWGNKAWHNRKHQFCREKHLHEFCEGFRAGYAAVTDGAEGCTPAFPPRQYWGWKYQSAEGQEKVAAWYAGFPHGARAAEEDGIGTWTQIQTSNNVQRRFEENGMLGPGQSVGMYPMPEAQPIAAAYANKLKANGAVPQPDTLMSDANPEHTPSSQGQLLRK
jgi:hypothetical protein